MLEILRNITKRSRIQLLLTGFLLLFVYKVLFDISSSILLLLINDILIIFVFYYLVLVVHEIIFRKRNSPLSLIISMLILFAVTLLVVNLSGTFFQGEDNKGLIIFLKKNDSVSILFSFIINSFIIFVLAYSFLVFRELFFLKQKRNLNSYYTALIVFLLLSSFSSVLDQYEDVRFIKLALTANTIILITINSARISWIAFLNKKEKRQLLGISIGMILLFSFYISNSTDNGIVYSTIGYFSNTLNQFNLLISIYGLIYFGFLFFTTLFHLPTAEAYDRKATEVSALQYFSKMINRVLDFEEMLETITEQALNVSNSDHAFIVMDGEQQKFPTGLKNISIVNANRIYSEYWKRSNLQKQNSVLSFNFDPMLLTKETNEKVSEITVTRFKGHNNSNGLLFVSRKESIPYDEEERSLIQTFTDYASIAIENSRLLAESIEKERLEQELQVAREMQLKLLPQKIPEYKEFEISAVFIPAFEVGGDYYDFFELEENKLGFVIADVSGKGVSAAFIMAEIRGIFESLAKSGSSPKETLVKANMILERTLDKKSFVSGIYGYIARNTGELVFCRAGHPSLLIAGREGIREYTPAGCGLGLTYSEIFETTLEEIKVKLEKDDVVILYTDGITESKNSKHEDFGIEKLKEIINNNKSESSDKISSEIIKEVTTFSENHSQHDDITLVIFKWKQ
ncbi:MAG: GAF domain-containing SpoIIE family protein phosphatase [Ignavibacteriaceae bacterium]